MDLAMNLNRLLKRLHIVPDLLASKKQEEGRLSELERAELDQKETLEVAAEEAEKAKRYDMTEEQFWQAIYSRKSGGSNERR